MSDFVGSRQTQAGIPHLGDDAPLRRSKNHLDEIREKGKSVIWIPLRDTSVRIETKRGEKEEGNYHTRRVRSRVEEAA